MPSPDDSWNAAAEEKYWREELEMMRAGADAIEQKRGLNTTGFYVACLGGLDAATHFTNREHFVSRAAFVAELRRLLSQPTAPSRAVPNVEEYHKAQRHWLENTIKSYEPGS